MTTTPSTEDRIRAVTIHPGCPLGLGLRIQEVLAGYEEQSGIKIQVHDRGTGIVATVAP